MQYDPYNNGITITAHGQDQFGSLMFPTMEEVVGEMLLIEKTVSASEAIKMSDVSYVESLKKQIVHEMVEKILKSHWVEFTKQEDLKTGDHTVRARAFLVPDNRIRELKKHGY